MLGYKLCGGDHGLLTTDLNCYNVRVTGQLHANMECLIAQHSDCNECDKHNIDEIESQHWYHTTITQRTKAGTFAKYLPPYGEKNNASFSKVVFGTGIILHHELPSTRPPSHVLKHSLRCNLLMYLIKDYIDYPQHISTALRRNALFVNFLL